MSSKRIHRVTSGVLTLALSAGLAAAQNVQPAGQPGAQPIRVQPVRPAPSGQVPDNILVKTEDGKIHRWNTNVDLLALKVNPLISDEEFESLKPAIVEWQKKVDRQVIENPDFASAFDTGFIDRLTLENVAEVRQATQMVEQLAATGPLSGYLQRERLLSPQQFQSTSKIVADYQQALMNELATPKPGADEQKQLDAVSNFLYEISTEDALRSYRRQLVGAASQLDNVLLKLELTPEQESSLGGPLAKARSATSDAEKLETMRAVMAGLTTPQQRTLLLEAYQLAKPFDPVASLPTDLPAKPELVQSEPEPEPAAQPPAAGEGDPAPEKPVATSTTPGGVLIEDFVVGEGEEVQPGATVTIHYRGTLKDGTEFDSSYSRNQPATFPLGNLIKGWQEGIPGMKVGGKRKLTIPWSLAYGERGAPPKIPPKSDLIFEIEMLGVRNR